MTRVDRIADDVGTGDGVALAGPGHPRTHAGLELLGRGHGRTLPAASAATAPRAARRRSRGIRSEEDVRAVQRLEALAVPFAPHRRPAWTTGLGLGVRLAGAHGRPGGALAQR